eukprot:3747318-Rhodomonas_salina.1
MRRSESKWGITAWGIMMASRWSPADSGLTESAAGCGSNSCPGPRSPPGRVQSCGTSTCRCLSP